MPANAVTYFVLFVIDIATRRVKIAGITNSPNGPWMKHVAKNLTDQVDGFLLGKKDLIMDVSVSLTASSIFSG